MKLEVAKYLDKVLIKIGAAHSETRLEIDRTEGLDRIIETSRRIGYTQAISDVVVILQGIANEEND